jgi:methionyl aminopeptidase
MIKLKSREEIELMRESALLVSKTLGMLAPWLSRVSQRSNSTSLPKNSFVTMVAYPAFSAYMTFPIRFA